MATPTESPITPQIRAAAAAIHRRLLFASNRRTLGRRVCWAVGTEPGEPGREGVAAMAPGSPATDDAEVALNAGRPVGSGWKSVRGGIAHDGAPVTGSYAERYAAFL